MYLVCLLFDELSIGELYSGEVSAGNTGKLIDGEDCSTGGTRMNTSDQPY